MPIQKIVVSNRWTKEERARLKEAISDDLRQRREHAPAWVLSKTHPEEDAAQVYETEQQRLRRCLQMLQTARAAFLEEHRRDFSDWLR